ncbi:MAG: DUF86 domain-containing protein [Bacteroidota bacterium]
MYDNELVLNILLQLIDASKKILERFEPINNPDNFLKSPRGNEKLDAICMQLIAIGESTKKLDKLTEFQLLSRYPEIDWKGIKGIRDIISHHYFDIDEEEIFNVCKNHIPTLLRAHWKG